MLRLLVPDDLVQIAEVDGEPAAMIVAFPNVNEAIQDLNGRLFPFGWLKLLWRLKVRHPSTLRVPLMGVRKQYQNSRVGAALALRVIAAARDPAVQRGIRQAELSWILEDNTGTRNIIESLGGTVYKRHRIYGKEVGRLDMSTGGQIEKSTQQRVVKLFRDTLSYEYLGNWTDREGNPNIEDKGN